MECPLATTTNRKTKVNTILSSLKSYYLLTHLVQKGAEPTTTKEEGTSLCIILKHAQQRVWPITIMFVTNIHPQEIKHSKGVDSQDMNRRSLESSIEYHKVNPADNGRNKMQTDVQS